MKQFKPFQKVAILSESDGKGNHRDWYHDPLVPLHHENKM